MVNVENLKYAIKKMINEEIKVCVEVGKKVNDDDKSKIEKIIVSREMSISTYIEYKQYLVLANYLGINRKMLEFVYENYTPYFLYELVKKKYISIDNINSNPLDDELASLSLSKFTIELQSAIEISDIIYTSLSNKSEWKNILINQIKLIDCRECSNKYLKILDETVKSVFDNSDVELPKKYAEKLSEFSGDIFIHNKYTGEDRNKILAQRINYFSRENKCNVFVIGAAHFGGVYGLEKILQNVEILFIEY